MNTCYYKDCSGNKRTALQDLTTPLNYIHFTYVRTLQSTVQGFYIKCVALLM